MLEVTNSTTIATSPLRVWTTLSDLEGYGRWHPSVRMTGEAALGAEVGYTFPSRYIRRAFTTRATITRLSKPREIAWRTGLNGMLSIEEIYEIEPMPNGTQVRHRMQWTGLLMKLGFGDLTTRALGSLAAADRALERYLRQALSHPAPSRKAPRNARQSTAWPPTVLWSGKLIDE